jgi:hypothetical protein
VISAIYEVSEMAKAAKTTPATQQAQTTNATKSKDFDMAKVNRYVDDFNKVMGEFNDSLKPHRQSFIKIARLIKGAKSKGGLSSKKPKMHEGLSEWARFMELVNIDKFYVSRMMRIAKHADTLEKYADRLPNTEAGLYFIAGLLDKNEQKGVEYIESLEVRHMSTQALKIKAGITPSAAKRHSVTMGIVEGKPHLPEDVSKRLLNLATKAGASFCYKLEFILSDISDSAERQNFIDAVDKIAAPVKATDVAVKPTRATIPGFVEANNAINSVLLSFSKKPIAVG